MRPDWLGITEVFSMRLRQIGFACVLVLAGSLAGLAQQQAGPGTLENLLQDKPAVPAQRPSAADASESTAPIALPTGRVQGAVARPKESVQHPDLDAAWAEYDKEMDAVAQSVETAIEQNLNAAAAAGDLDASLRWKAAGEQFQKDGQIPEEFDETKADGRLKTKPQKPGISPRSRIAEAKTRLAAAYEAVEKSLVKSHSLEKAQQARAEREALRGQDRPNTIAVFIGSWINDSNKEHQLIRADGKYIVNHNPAHEWSGTWSLDTRDPKGPSIIRASNNGKTTRFYVNPDNPQILMHSDGRMRRE